VNYSASNCRLALFALAASGAIDPKLRNHAKEGQSEAHRLVEAGIGFLFFDDDNELLGNYKIALRLADMPKRETLRARLYTGHIANEYDIKARDSKPPDETTCQSFMHLFVRTAQGVSL
jgi:hypothetical protein